MAKMWAGRTAGKTDQIADDFNSSIHFDSRLYREDITGSMAHASMLKKQNIIPSKAADHIIAGLSDILADLESGELEIDETCEDIHMFVEQVLTERIGEEGKMLHTARSRNDQVALDMRMYMRTKVNEIITLVKGLTEVLADSAEKYSDVILPGYTHLQRAQPIYFGHHLLAYAMMLVRDISRLEDASKRMDESPIGACALAGTTYDTDRVYEAQLLGFTGVCANSLDAVSDRDFCLETLSALSILMMHLSRFSEEIILWSSWEFRFVELSDAYTTGSSIMPQKKNSDMAELVKHPCEMYCRRGMVDDPMNIRGLKRFAVDHADDYDMTDKKAPATGKKIAIIGGGPAGLSAAYYLTLMGHACTIFEARHHLGGMLRYGIPAYRLPHDELQKEIDWILRLGIEVKLDTYVTDVAALKEQGFDAVYIAIGAHKDNKLGLPGEDAEGVISAVELLRDMGDEKPRDFTGKKVAVIGGGNVAMDVARTSVRLGAEKVTIVYRRRVSDMTAQDEEIIGAKEEGCEFLELHAPKQIVVEDGKVAGLVVERQIISGLNRGRFAVHKADAESFVLPFDVVAVAIGQAIDSTPFEEQGIPCSRGRIQTTPDGAIPGFDGVFSGGDCQTGPATVIRAINAGKVAAGNIDNYLGFNHVLDFPVDLPPVKFKGKVSCARCEMTERECNDRIHDFELIEWGLTHEEACQEASRCLRCDHFGFGAFRGGRVFEW